MRKIITFLLWGVSIYSFGQYVDNFSDGNFGDNPVWSGAVDKFVINASKQLQLQAPVVTSTAYLSTPSAAINDATWEFTMRANLLLTSANYVNFYLVADTSVLSGALNGYYVMIGNTNKEIALYRQTGTIKTKLVAGIAQRLPTSGSVTEITVRVLRDGIGNWMIYSKLPSETAFLKEAAVVDSTYTKSLFSGVFCNYSSTNSSKYFFDDFNVTGNPFRDAKPPLLLSYSFDGEKVLTAYFSEPVSLENATIVMPNGLENYTKSLSGTMLKITFASPIPKFQHLAVTLKNVSDLAGNLLPDTDLKFGLFPTGFADLVFNEIMCDPTPVVGLPEVEYIELYNSRNFDIDVSDWKLVYGEKKYSINGGVIPANGYILLCGQSAASALGRYGGVAAMSSFPSLSAAGQLVYLLNDKDSLIAFVNYTDRWYTDDFKKTGGWALECVDTHNLSGSDLNWMASVDRSGGTPGRANSVVSRVIDDVKPQIETVSFVSPDTLVVYFTKPMRLSSICNVSKFAVSGDINIKVIGIDFPQGKWVKMKLLTALQKNMSYWLLVDSLSDIDGLYLTDKMRFGVADSCEAGDVVINEVLSHPKPGGAVFVELYNRSEKIINLRDLWLNRLKSNGSVDAGFPVSYQGQPFFPGEYVVLTPQKSGVCNFYSCDTIGGWLEMTNFVSLPNTAGNVMLVNRQGEVVDEMDYDEKNHHLTVKDPAGVSFERVNPAWSSDDLSNWRSCASDAGYATPGYRNSHYCSDSLDYKGSLFWLKNEQFTPDNDGVDDVLSICYKMPESGYSASITVYTATGIKVKRVGVNVLLGAEGQFFWNGDSDLGKLMPAGIYIVYVDMVHPEKGEHHTAKLACVLAVE